MKKIKIAIIGAGSTYTPELIEGLIQRQESFPVSELILMDIDNGKLEVVGSLAQRMLSATNYEGKMTLTGDLDEAIRGADFVFAQIRVGGMAARIQDEKIPLKHGLLGQETTGVGGFMNALRTVPVMVDIAKRIEKLAPDAWLINFSNPSGIIAQAILDNTNIKMVGLCNNPVNMLHGIKEVIATDDFEYQYVGLNHLSWITSVVLDGKEMLPELLGTSHSSMKNVPDIDYPQNLLDAVPAIPCAYLSYYYMRNRQIRKLMDAEKCRGEEVMELEGSLLEKYKDTQRTVKPPELESRGGALYSTAAISLADAIYNGRPEVHVVNVKNEGTVPFLQPGDVVETKCRVGSNRLTPIELGAFDNQYIVGLVQAVKAYEKLTVEAALTGCRKKALAALMVHPLIGDYDKANSVLEEMLLANAKYLPKFRANQVNIGYTERG